MLIPINVRIHRWFSWQHTFFAFEGTERQEFSPLQIMWWDVSVWLSGRKILVYGNRRESCVIQTRAMFKTELYYLKNFKYFNCIFEICRCYLYLSTTINHPNKGNLQRLGLNLIGYLSNLRSIKANKKNSISILTSLMPIRNSRSIHITKITRPNTYGSITLEIKSCR
jgi:hypothetical protein